LSRIQHLKLSGSDSIVGGPLPEKLNALVDIIELLIEDFPYTYGELPNIIRESKKVLGIKSDADLDE
jgi:hypothetical protein